MSIFCLKRRGNLRERYRQHRTNQKFSKHRCSINYWVLLAINARFRKFSRKSARSTANTKWSMKFIRRASDDLIVGREKKRPEIFSSTNQFVWCSAVLWTHFIPPKKSFFNIKISIFYSTPAATNFHKSTGCSCSAGEKKKKVADSKKWNKLHIVGCERGVTRVMCTQSGRTNCKRGARRSGRHQIDPPKYSPNAQTRAVVQKDSPRRRASKLH